MPKKRKRNDKKIKVEELEQKIEETEEILNETEDILFISSNEENLKELLYQLNEIKEENNTSKSISFIVKSIEGLVIEYYEISNRIFNEIKMIKEKEIYDELTFVKAQENLDKLLIYRGEIKDKIIKAAMQLEKIFLEKEKQKIMKDRQNASALQDISDVIESSEF